MKPFKDPGGWPEDSGDKYLPEEPGFISDWVLSQRGSEVPTLFGIWSAIFAMSVAVKREAWLKWGQGKFFCNLYVLLIGPPGLSKKSTAVSRVAKVLREMVDRIKDVNVKALKDPNIVMGKATPESILEAMQEKARNIPVKAPDGRNIFEDGKPKRYERGHDLVLLLSELTSMFSSQRYSDSLTDNLLDIYDCHDFWEWRTVKRGAIRMRNLHTSLLGGTTPYAFQNSVPESVIGDGFISRTVLVYVPNNTRTHDEPEDHPNIPTPYDLGERLAYIAQNCWGEHYFSEEAREHFKAWYTVVKKRIEAAPPELQGSLSRLDVVARKVSLFVKAQRYSDRRDRVIQLDDVKYAIFLVESTFNRNFGLLRSVVFDDFSQNASKLLNGIRNYYIKHKEPITKKRLMGNVRMKANDLKTAISLLYVDGSLKCYNVDGESTGPRFTSHERYMPTDLADNYRAPKVTGDDDAEG